MSTIKCTYCSTELGELEDQSAGDEIFCPECEVTYEFVAENHDSELKYYICPSCNLKNKRSVKVAEAGKDISCENPGCQFQYAPEEADTEEVPESDMRLKMKPLDGGD